MDSGAQVLKIKVLYISLLASTLLPLSDAINLGRAFNIGQKISRSTFIKSWKSLKSLNSLNNYPTSLESSYFDSYGSPSLAPTPTPTYSPVPNPTHNNFAPPSSYVNVSPPKMYLQPPPPNNKRPAEHGVWCVAKPTVPDEIVQVAMDYACGSGADCKVIQPNGSCYQPNTLLAHASYAFNSYWQKTKFGGGTCHFGGTAMLVTVDPSYNKCNYTLA